MSTPSDEPLPPKRPLTPSGDHPPVERTRSGLLVMLDTIDVEGWDGQAATVLLTHVRYELVRPLTIDVGLRGAAASQAEATAWEAVWLQLCDPDLRSARSPWGVIWQTARRAVLGEILAARWGTNGRSAWKHDAKERAGRAFRPISLEPLLANGVEPMAIGPSGADRTSTDVSAALHLAAGALVDAGWSTTAAEDIVGEVAMMDEALGHGATVVGWRPLAARLALPPWQARRLTFALRGSCDVPGLIARLIAEGPRVAKCPAVREMLAGTLTRTLPSPTHRRPAVAPERRHAQRVAH